jgi:hypothetical protein
VSTPSEPPKPPEIERRIRFRLYQWIGVPLLLLAPPILALVGVLDERYETVTGEGGTLGVTVEYPSRLRYRQEGAITVQLPQRGEADSLDVSLADAYARGFTDIVATPAFDPPYRAAVPGDARRVVIELKADRYGRHRGTLEISSRGGGSVSIPLATTILP